MTECLTFPRLDLACAHSWEGSQSIVGPFEQQNYGYGHCRRCRWSFLERGGDCCADEEMEPFCATILTTMLIATLLLTLREKRELSMEEIVAVDRAVARMS
eukprot:scaffold2266_cov166-Ochromonas_danica.AAC.5